MVDLIHTIIPITMVMIVCGAFLWLEELVRPFLYVFTILDTDVKRMRYRSAISAFVSAIFVFSAASIVTRGDQVVVCGGLIGLGILLIALNGYVFSTDEHK